jgi:nucleoid-associated protein YgaU
MLTLATPNLCDRCGRTESAPAAGDRRFSFCPACGLFVCPECWFEERGECRGCAQPGLPPPGQLKASILATLAPRLGPPRAGPPANPRPGVFLANPIQPRPQPDPQPLWRRGLARALVIRPQRAHVAAMGQALHDLPTRLAIAGVLAVPLIVGIWAFDLATSPSAPQSSHNQTQAVLGDRNATASPEPLQSSATPEVYVVRPGDTLASLARRFYGSEGKWEKIYAANRERIDNPDSLDVGSRLVIP